jgi:hypothetical protein
LQKYHWLIDSLLSSCRKFDNTKIAGEMEKPQEKNDALSHLLTEESRRPVVRRTPPTP